MITSLTKSFDSIVVICFTDAPNTFLIPISLVRCSAVKAAKANNPSAEIIMATREKIKMSVDVFISALYNLLKLSSKKVYEKGWVGINFDQTTSIALNVFGMLPGIVLIKK